jgi:hypothetical protein
VAHIAHEKTFSMQPIEALQKVEAPRQQTVSVKTPQALRAPRSPFRGNDFSSCECVAEGLKCGVHMPEAPQHFSAGGKCK